jgi:hypothetical protein
MPIQRGVRFVPQRPKSTDLEEYQITEKIVAELELKGDERGKALCEIEGVMQRLRKSRTEKDRSC